MSTPSIGLITQEWGQIVYAEQARKLGVSIKCSSQPMSVTDLVKFAKDQSFLFVDPRIVKLPTIKSAEKLGITIYPTSKTLEQLEKIETFPISGDYLSIFVARSAHAQLSSWPITLISNQLSITPLPGITDEISAQIQQSVMNLAAELNLIGGLELLVDAANYKKLIGFNWVTPDAKYWSQFGSVTSFYEQSLRAVLDLPLGSTKIAERFVVTGNLETDKDSDDYRPYLHLMARNPSLKFDQSIKQVGIAGDDLEHLLTEIIHTQDYYSGKIEE